MQCDRSEEDEKFCFALTSWKALGECRWPFDPEWAHHRTIWATYNLPPTFKLDISIQDDFEKAPRHPGIFEYLEDRRQNVLPLPETMEDRRINSGDQRTNSTKLYVEEEHQRPSEAVEGMD